MPLTDQKLLNKCRESQVSCYTTACFHVRPRQTVLGRCAKESMLVPGLGLMALRQSDENLARLRLSGFGFQMPAAASLRMSEASATSSLKIGGALWRTMSSLRI